MAQVVGFEPTENHGVKDRCLRPLGYTCILCTSPPNPDSPQRTSNSFLRPTGHGLFYLSFCYHYEVHERRNFSCLYERNKRLSGVRGGSRTPICGTGGHRFQPLNYSHISDFHLFLISTDVLSISHSVFLSRVFRNFFFKKFF